MRLALYQPDIPQNTGTILRMAACLGLTVDIIEPTGFDMTDRGLRRAGLDYLESVTIVRHRSFDVFLSQRQGPDAGRLVLMTTSGEVAYTKFAFEAEDTLMLGRESAGVPDHVRQAAHMRLHIPMKPGLRSLNIAVAAAMVVGEALRQTGGPAFTRAT